MTTYTKRHQKIHKNKLYAVNIPGRETSLLIQELGSSVQGTVHSKIEFKIYWFRKIYVEPYCLRCVLRCNYGNGETEGIRTGNVWCTPSLKELPDMCSVPFKETQMEKSV